MQMEGLANDNAWDADFQFVDGVRVDNGELTLQKGWAGLASNNLGMDSLAQRLMKELGVALLNGIICSGLIMIITSLIGYPNSISFTVSISLMAVIIFAALFGTFIPLVLDKYKIDPALATGPFITTVNDVLGLFIYFMIGKLFLNL